MPDDLRTRLEKHLGDEYVIEHELGGGGMARVFLAREVALDRRVVIKALVPELAADLSGRRFEREIRVAAGLQHANIVPVLRAGDASGQPYYVMPFVEGRSLRDAMREAGRFELTRSLGLLRDIARAIAHAHDRGVVHRDIKPENVLLSGDAAVVTDFGIAKAIASARDGDTGDPVASGTELTMSGMMLGTPAYAAPEQVLGDRAIDHRADLYSFGVLAYELLAGGAPFVGSSAQQLLAQHLSEPPAPLGERCPECPPPVTRLVMQCLEKAPDRRPGSMREVLTVLDSESTRAGLLARLRQRVTRRQRLAGQVVGVAVALGVAAAAAMRVAGPTPLHAVAVIPFLSERADTSGEYVADGLADGLATSLGRSPRIRLVSRALSGRFRGRREFDVAAVADSLSAQYLVTGVVRDLGGSLRVSVAVTDARTSTEIWSDHVDGGASDVLALQERLNARVVSGLADRLGLALDEGAALNAGGTADQAAYDLFMRARYLALRRGAGVRQSIALYDSAVVRDPRFGRAHAGLALALQLLPYFESVDARSLHDRTMAAAARALAVDSTLGEAHVALAMAHQHAFEWDAAEAAYRRAIALDPEEPDVNIQYARFLWYTGRGPEALRQFEQARRIDPYSAVASGWLGGVRFYTGDTLAGLAEVERAMQIDSTSPPTMIFAARTLAAVGRAGEARAIMRRLWDQTPSWRTPAAAVLADVGEPEWARGLLEAVQRPEAASPVTGTMTAILTLALDDTARALDAMERAAAAREILPTYWSLSSPEFDVMRANPRFLAVVRRFGLDERRFGSPNGGRR